jgi:hypothetical protein
VRALLIESDEMVFSKKSGGLQLVFLAVACAVPSIAWCEKPDRGFHFEVGVGPVFHHRFNEHSVSAASMNVDTVGVGVDLALSRPIWGSMSWQVGLQGRRFGGGDPIETLAICMDCYYLDNLLGVAANAGVRIDGEHGGIGLFASAGPQYELEIGDYSGGLSSNGTSKTFHGFGGTLRAGVVIPMSEVVSVGGSLLGYGDQHKIGGGATVFLRL